VRRLDIDGWLGLVVDGQRLLVRSATAAVVLRTLVAYPQAALVELDAYARGGSVTGDPPRVEERDGGWFSYGDYVPGQTLLREVEVGFGTMTVDPVLAPALRPWRAGPLRWHLADVRPGRGTSDGTIDTARYLLYPYPPTADLRIAVAWRSRDIAPSVVPLELPAPDVVAARTTTIW
jgi:hypothetical protein